ncbi:MAG TPA: hypothetical protein VJ911_03465, partial [Cryomorphaceae bacterium]|nr:hypothetical protein [Cryomorphaceae bacterium]
MKPMSYLASQKRTVSAMLYNSVIFLSFFLFSFSSHAQPPNDDPCNAITVNCGSNISSSTLGATESTLGVPGCSSGEVLDVFYSINAVANTTYEVTVNGASYDGVLAAYTGVCDGVLTQIACADLIGNNVLETISFTVASSQTVLIQNYDWIGAGAFDLSVSCASTNTTCVNATPIEFGGDPVYGNNTGAGPSGPEMGCAFAGDLVQNVLWYSFTAPSDGSLIIETLSEPDIVDLTDTQIQLLDACGGEVLACDDDGGSGLLSRIELACDTYNAGETYYLQVDGYSGQVGTFKFQTSSESCPVPANDLCANATGIAVNLPGECPGNAIEGTTSGSSN